MVCLVCLRLILSGAYPALIAASMASGFGRANPRSCSCTLRPVGLQEAAAQFELARPAWRTPGRLRETRPEVNQRAYRLLLR
ncbi:hypothetical protein T492DRAFT_1087128 [Pavlovales sp. CCMP2436]|nr:hypothetical protein T492DRAFT_1087128 [Pavlovales sp. CCMP2436]